MSAHLRMQSYKLHFDDTLRRYAQALSPSHRQTFWRLVKAIRCRSTLLSPAAYLGQSAWCAQLIGALVAIAGYSKAWVKQPESWVAEATSSAEQFRSLVKHLFELYPVPNLMARAWLNPTSEPWQVALYLHLASGKSIRQFLFPKEMTMKLSKKAACWFMQAPDDLAPIAAMRWSQVRALGGDAALARLLATNEILRCVTNCEYFWESVIRFLVNNQPMSLEECTAIVRFIHEQKYLPAALVMRDYQWTAETGSLPLQPHFSLKGRSLRSLRRHMTNWMSEVALKRPLPASKRRGTWLGCQQIRPFVFQQDDQVWMIEELVSRDSLVLEGRVMRHCVASYCHKCFRGWTSIWSMKVTVDGKCRRELTIEIASAQKIIRQAKGYGNAPPSPKATSVLQRWAIREGLRL